MPSLLKVARDRAREASSRRILLSIPDRGVDLVCTTVTGDQVARTGRQAKRRHPDDGFMQSLAQGLALLAESTVQIIVDGQIAETDDGETVTFKTQSEWPELDAKSASEAVRGLVGRDGDVTVLAVALMKESGFDPDGSAMVADENPTS